MFSTGAKLHLLRNAGTNKMVVERTRSLYELFTVRKKRYLGKGLPQEFHFHYFPRDAITL